MYKIIFSILLTLPMCASAVEFGASYGIGFRSASDSTVTVSASYYYHKNLYLQGKAMAVKSGGRFAFLNLGFTGYGLHWVMGAGKSYNIDNDPLLTGSRQFNLGIFYEVSSNTRVGWSHISNCAKICWNGRRKDLYPNFGRDYLTIEYFVK